MACCKCCCGGVDCTEGQEGKCCCGGISGECCQEGEYCCSGACQGTPCCESDEDCAEGQYCCNGGCHDGPCCNTAADCPTFGMTCADIFPGAPELCCDGVCEPHACYPGAEITLSFTKKAGCTAAFLSHLADGDPFDVVISGGSLGQCGVTSAEATGAPCVTAWTLGEDCVVTNLTFSAGSDPTCEDCYTFVSWTSCRLDCDGDCV